MSKLGELLKKRHERHQEEGRDIERQITAYEDVVRERQGWRKPWYHHSSSENGWPPEYMGGRKQ